MKKVETTKTKTKRTSLDGSENVDEEGGDDEDEVEEDDDFGVENPKFDMASSG